MSVLESNEPRSYLMLPGFLPPQENKTFFLEARFSLVKGRQHSGISMLGS